MINEVLEVIVEKELNHFLQRPDPNALPGAPPPKESVRIGKLEDSTESNDSNTRTVVCSLVNIEQERSTLNNPARSKSPKKNNPVNINLYLLFSADFDNYKIGLNRLSAIIAFFQSKPFFTPDNTPGLPAGIDKLTVEMISLNMQELSNFWTAIGSKVLPAVIYKLRMIPISADRVQAIESEISKVEVNTD
jgi:hypothetical protein